MHPDAIIAGLRRELDRLDQDADDYVDRKKAIEEEIKRTDGLDRPEVTAEDPETIIDQNVPYLAGLRKELERAADDAKAEIVKEIRRVEALLHHGEKPVEKSAAKVKEPANADA